jgi:transposase-like protein
MKIRLMIPDVNASPTDRPRSCPYCEGAILHRHATLRKPIKDHRCAEVEVHRYKCLSCERTFRHYPVGVSGKDQSHRTVALAALMYALGLSCSAASHILGALGAPVCKMTVWRDAQQAGESLRSKRPSGRVRVIGADETVFRVRGEEVVVGFVVDSQSGETLGFEVLVEGDGRAFSRWLLGYVEQFGARVLVSDDNDSYSVAASHLGLEHQLCVAHVRKYVRRRARAILEQAEREYGDEDEKLEKLKADLKVLVGQLKELPEDGGGRIGRMHREYLWAVPPARKGRGQRATAAYRMRMLTLQVWNDWKKIRLHLSRPELLLDGTNNASERSIAKSKVRYKTMRGYKSTEGMKNGIALTQWLYNGEDEHDLAREMVA